jgi:hypothetical protein
VDLLGVDAEQTYRKRVHFYKQQAAQSSRHEVSVAAAAASVTALQSKNNLRNSVIHAFQQYCV